MSPWAFVAIGAFASVADFLVGLWLSRRGADSSPLYAEGGKQLSPEAVNRVGRLVMLISPIPVIALTIVGFFVIGPEGGQ